MAIYTYRMTEVVGNTYYVVSSPHPCFYYVCDTEAELPLTGVTVGSFAWIIDTQKQWVCSSLLGTLAEWIKI